MKLLIVDDHPRIRHTIREILARRDDDVRECASGFDAIRLAGDFQPDYLTMDVHMPGISGIEAVRSILAVCPGVRAIMVSGNDDPELRTAAAEAGAAGYVLKDNLIELLPLLGRLSLNGRRPAPSGNRAGPAEGTP
jgi:DNA-binding NarL/FixJ family response regulator